jgi:hypothetical protein
MHKLRSIIEDETNFKTYFNFYAITLCMIILKVNTQEYVNIFFLFKYIINRLRENKDDLRMTFLMIINSFTKKFKLKYTLIAGKVLFNSKN